MSFANQNSRWPYTPNGVTTSFGYDNKILAATDLVVTWYDANGNTLVLPAYSVTGVGNAGGGAVVFATAPAATAGSLIVIERVTPAVQDGSFLDFLQEASETRQERFERGMAGLQEVRQGFRRTLQFSPHDADGALVLPPAGLRANQSLLFGPDGAPTVGSVFAAGNLVVSAFVQTMLDDADAAAVLGTLGYSAFVKGLRAVADAAAFRAAIGAVDGSGIVGVPQGRLTLATGEAVMTAARTARTVLYYTPYTGQLVPIWNGAIFVPTVFAELTNDTTQSVTGKAGPAVVAADKNYDGFVWNDGGTKRLTRGPLWASNTDRGAGAGTTELERVQGIWVNKYDIVNGPLARFGTYVGSVRSDGAAKLNWQPGGAQAGGLPALLGVWNAYNRVECAGAVSDSTDTWNYSLAVVRSANGSDGNRVSFLQGLQEEAFEAAYDAMFIDVGSAAVVPGIGYDRNNGLDGIYSVQSAGNAIRMSHSGSHRVQAFGHHFMQAVEFVLSSGATTTWFGDGGGAVPVNTGLRWRGLF